jgi:excinuclease UvrABC helicase subunit UvrB
MASFDLRLPFGLAGDQPDAIAELTAGLESGSDTRRCSA